MPETLEAWPAITEAYAFVLPSYQWLLARFEAADNRLNALLTLLATLTLGAPVFAGTVRPGISFIAPTFRTAIFLFIVASFIGVIGRVAGGLRLPDPGFFYEHDLHKPVEEFRKDVLYFAGKHFEANREAIAAKHTCAFAMTAVMLTEIFFFVLWMIP